MAGQSPGLEFSLACVVVSLIAPLGEVKIPLTALKHIIGARIKNHSNSPQRTVDPHGNNLSSISGSVKITAANSMTSCLNL